MDTLHLQARLRCCIQAILEIEHDFTLNVQEIDVEFSKLRWFLDNLENLSLQESDVQRLESATERILEEMRLPILFSSKNETAVHIDRVQ